jgi:hypothetical protein
MRRKTGEIMKIFEKLEHPKNRGVTFWPKNNWLLVVEIFDQL